MIKTILCVEDDRFIGGGTAAVGPRTPLVTL